MADLKVCRICLRIGGKMYEDDQFQLNMYYENVIALKIIKMDHVPLYFCYECAMLLYKFHKFKEKCHYSQRKLKSLLVRPPITYQAINSIKTNNKEMYTNLSIATVNKRVKTYLFNETPDEIIKKNKSEDKKGDEIYNSDDCALDDHLNDVNIKNEDSPRSDVSSPMHSSSDSDFFPKQDVTEVFIKDDVLKTEIFKVECPETEKNSDETENRDKKLVSKDRCLRKRKKEVLNTQKNYKFTTRQKRYLDSNKWRKISLNEEEAIRDFEKRAIDPKYVQATYHCKDCYKFFSKEDIMLRHFKLRHNPSIGPFECRFCHSRFRLECHLRKHIRTHYTKYQCLVCNLVVAIETTALMHEETHAGITRACKYCGEQFRHMSTYYTHLRTHRSRHVCALCGASFVSAAGLHQHKRVTHVGREECTESAESENTFCERCQIKFESSDAYAEHLQSSALHADVDKEDDEEVPAPKRRSKRLRFTFTRRRKPMDCYQCGKHFSTQMECMNHHQKEHPGTSFCPPSERHICEICGASLAPGSIAMHQNLHTREKIYNCETCGRQFYSTAGLKRHRVTHTGEKPYECPLCEKRFTQNNSMKLHYRTIHLKQPYPKRIRSKKKDGGLKSVPMESEEEMY
ncbi:zinc finger and SCAN domain-containing protein 2-like [Papilio machaon]|uniref:zinc finger and SCAN domain-containing protein 2-like n=1 Tax=Papilio machaon TaxID=76193 RepID=UPI001E664EC7|nr:zinc finger and SCAN domain-containing protein 2-like [Papilio machaon]